MENLLFPQSFLFPPSASTSLMLNFAPLKNREVTLAEFTAAFSPTDLQRLTNEMVDHMLDLIADHAQRPFCVKGERQRPARQAERNGLA
jgi:hypothetical protein